MWSLAFVGAALQGYGPPFVVAAFWLYKYPQLQIIALFTTLVGIFAMYPLAILFTAGLKESAPGVYPIVGAVVKEVSRLAVCWLVLSMEVVFRSHVQVLHNSRFRLVMLGGAVGFGLGLAQLLLIFGTTLEAYNRVSAGEGAEMYNLDACTVLPFAFFQALQSNLAMLFEVLATMVVLPALAGIRNMGPGARRSTARSGLVESGSQSPGYSGGDSTSGTASSGGDSDGAKKAKKPKPAARGRKNVLPPTPPKASTSFTSLFGVVLVAVVLVLHLVFSGFSTLNSGSINWASHSHQVGGRGCQVSLPVQLLVTLGLLALAILVAFREAVSRKDTSGAVDGEYRAVDGESQALVATATSVQ